jgi:hypothetical protein
MQESYKMQGELATIKETENHRISWVKQGTLLEIPRDKTPYALASMSECSFVIGINEQSMIAAHISFSLKSQINEVLAHCENKGINRTDTYLIANTGPVLGPANEDGFLSGDRRLSTGEECKSLRIPTNNIRTFEYKIEDTEQKSVRKNLQLVVASPEMVFTSGFNENQNGPGKQAWEQEFPDDKEQLIKL